MADKKEKKKVSITDRKRLEAIAQSFSKRTDEEEKKFREEQKKKAKK